MKKIITSLLIFLLLALPLGGCVLRGQYKKYTSTIFATFDTVIQITAYAKSEQEFDSYFQMAAARFKQLHKLYDIYHDYEGINNIKTINDNAGIRPVPVEQEIIALLAFSQEWCQRTGGKTNIALGPVLRIWHNYRSAAIANPAEARLPTQGALVEASLHTDINKVVLDKARGTVFLEEEDMALDVGAVAKGFAVELVARELSAAGLKAGVINAGGNVRSLGIPPDGRETWTIGLEDPRGERKILTSLNVGETAVVTSSGQQRHYQVDGVHFHHIIDPATLWPATYHQAVTVVTPDSGLADFLSTALFILPYEEGLELVEKLKDVEAIWITPAGEIKFTAGLEGQLKGTG
ncbi:MAG: FAD:protein FMN transferase [Firmicutes bacterium]|nr:FAD:protein FMN transferase [Bacillota bacterium]